MPVFYIEDLGQIGIAKDKPPHSLPPNAWSDGLNVRFREGILENTSGYIPLSDYSDYLDEMYSIVYAYDGSKSWWTIAGKKADAEKIYSTTLEGVIRDTSPASGHSISDTDQHSGGNFDGTPIIANGRNSNVFYIPDLDGTGVATELRYDASTPALSSKLKFDVVRPMWQHLFGLGTEVVASSVDGVNRGYYPRLLWFSDAADPGSVPGSWDADDAGTLSRSYPDPFSTFRGALVDMVQLGQYAIVYQEDACHLATYSGQAPFVVNFRTALHEIGAIATNCVVPIRNQHVVLTGSDVVVHDTRKIESVLDARLRRWLFANMDPDNYKRSFLCANYEAGEAWICFPERGNEWCNLAIVWDFKANSTKIRELNPLTTFAANGKQTFGPGATKYNPADQILITLTADGDAFRMEYGSGYDGKPPASYVERSGLKIEGDSTARKLVRRLWPEVEADGDIQFYVGEQDCVDDAVKWEGPYTFTPGRDHSIPVRSSGRLHGLKISWTNCRSVKINRIGFEWIPVGQY